MSAAGADGERQAVRGYNWQYDQLACRVYDTLLNGTFRSLRLVDPTVGKVDDLVLVTETTTTGHQYKSQAEPGPLTLTNLLSAQQTRSGQPSPSLMRELAEGWSALRLKADSVEVQYVTNRPASTRDHLIEAGEPERPSPDHFAAFLTGVLEPLRNGALALDDVPVGWRSAVTRIQAATGLDDVGFAEFVRAVRIVVRQSNPLETIDARRRSDIKVLSDILFRRVAQASEVVTLDREQLTGLAGWTDRTRLRSLHQFPIDERTFEPLGAAVASFGHTLSNTTRGYVAVVGPPGSGKSTLLTHALTGTTDRVVRYYAYVPRGGASKNRLEASGFLHDIVLMLQSATGRQQSHLLDPDLAALRTEFDDLIHHAAAQYTETGQRTIVVVDGLDHVERDHPAADNLLGELPSPASLNDGVVFVVGTRSLSPLRGEVRTHLHESRVLDLSGHRLSRDAAVAICGRAPSTATLDLVVHERVAGLAAGHPLSLAYLLNELAGSDDTASAMAKLDDHIEYGGDIAASYQMLWDSLDPERHELLAIVVRLRIAFTYGDLVEWFGHPSARAFTTSLAYLFRYDGAGWTVFHDSFRQFVIGRTNLDRSVAPTDPAWDARYHAEIARRCAAASRKQLGWEEVFHRHLAGQDVAKFASQTLFREQAVALRSPEAIREDLGIVLRDAARRRNLLDFSAVLLARIEFEDRLAALQDVGLAGAYLRAGLVGEAVAFSDVNQRGHVPLVDVYRVATQLGLDGTPHGERIFAAIDGTGLADHGSTSRDSDDVGEAWAAAATLHRPLARVLEVLRATWPMSGKGDDDDFTPSRHDRPTLSRFRRMANQVCSTLVATGRIGDLDAIEALVAGLHPTIEDNDAAAERTGTLVDVSLHIARCRADRTDADEAEALLRDALTLTRNPMYDWRLCEWAQLALDLDETDVAFELISRLGLDHPLTPSNMGYSPDVSVRTRFDYWRIRHRIHRRTNPRSANRVLETAIAGGAQPERNYRDFPAERLATQIDEAIRTLAAAAAATDEHAAYDTSRLWTELVPMLGFVRRPRSASATFSGVHRNAIELLDVVIDVVAGHSPRALAHLADRLGSRFDEEPDLWTNTLRLRLARRFTEHGLAPHWYRKVIASEAANLPHLDTDLNGRLATAVELIDHHRRVGQLTEAQQLARSLVPMSFGVGYRKDYQFERWVECFDRAVRDGLADPVAEALFLARLLRVSGPMTEGAPRQSAARLLRTLGEHLPGCGVALFEYLVRHGAVDHLDALGELLDGLARCVNDEDSIQTIVDLVTDVLAAADQRAHVGVARAITDACARLPVGDRDRIVQQMRDRLGCYPLPTTRHDWLAATGAPLGRLTALDDDGASSFGHLTLDDGTTLNKLETSAAVASAADAIALRARETDGSTFDWVPVLQRLEIDDAGLVALTDLFAASTEPGTRERRDANTAVLLGRRWLDRGRADLAGECAALALERSSESAWNTQWGTSRPDAHCLAIAAGADEALQHAWDDLALCASDSPWTAEIIVNALGSIAEMLSTPLPAAQVWGLIHTHLTGMTLGVDLDEEDPLTYQPVRWWIATPSISVQRVGHATNAAEAVAALVADHATHPAWRLRDAAIAAASARIATPGSPIASAISTLLAADVPDDIVETLGRIAYFADVDNDTIADSLHHRLGGSDNAYIRQLSTRPTDQRRPLPARYSLVLPPATGGTVLGGAGTELWPFEEVVDMLADAADIDRDELLAHVDSAMRLHRNDYSDADEVRHAFKGADLQLMWASPSTFVVRTVVGRLIGEFTAAGILDNLTPLQQRRLAVFDPALVHVRPGPRPGQMPPPPGAGHDVTLELWIDGTAARLDAYVAAIAASEGLVVGAHTRTTVLNWGHLAETLTSTVVIGEPPAPGIAGSVGPRPINDYHLSHLLRPAPAADLRAGEPLVVENRAWRHHQLQTQWWSFSPFVASALGWAPATDTPGTWLTSSGDLAVTTIRWVDGWWGHAGRAFDDTEGDGQLVVASVVGAVELRAALPTISRVSNLTRSGHETKSGETVNRDCSAVSAELVADKGPTC